MFDHLSSCTLRDCSADKQSCGSSTGQGKRVAFQMDYQGSSPGTLIELVAGKQPKLPQNPSEN